jgi:hypothetical protein
VATDPPTLTPNPTSKGEKVLKAAKPAEGPIADSSEAGPLAPVTTQAYPANTARTVGAAKAGMGASAQSVSTMATSESPAVNGETNSLAENDEGSCNPCVEEASALVVPDPEKSTTSGLVDAALEAPEMEASTACDQPASAPVHDAVHSEEVAAQPTEGTGQADELLAENASTSSSSKENAPAHCGAGEVVPHGKDNIAKTVGEHEGPEEKVELAKLDSDMADDHIKSAVEEDKAAREKESEDEASTSSEEAVSSPKKIFKYTKEEMLNITNQPGLAKNKLGFTCPREEIQNMTCVSPEFKEQVNKAMEEMRGSRDEPGARPEGRGAGASGSGGAGRGDRGPRHNNRNNNPQHADSGHGSEGWGPGGSGRGEWSPKRNMGRGGGPQWSPRGERRSGPPSKEHVEGGMWARPPPPPPPPKVHKTENSYKCASRPTGSAPSEQNHMQEGPGSASLLQPLCCYTFRCL